MRPDPRHRLRWSLRGERAFGLGFVRAPSGGFAALADEVASADDAVTAVDRWPQAEVPSAPVRAPARVSPARPEELPAGAPRLPVTTPAEVATPAALFAGSPPPPEGLPPFTSAELSPDDKAAALAELNESQVRGCTKCPLSRTRRNTVFGEGDADAKLMFVGEGPGGTEDSTGRPFVGRAGQKLTEMIAAMGLTREQVYVCNVVKCRAFLPGPPPKDRPPQPDEAATCMPYLQRQIEIVRPKVIVTLGLSAMQYLLGVKQSMSRSRGNWHAWRGVRVMPTFHPSYILRNPTVETRRAVWDDLKQVMGELGIVPPGRPGG